MRARALALTGDLDKGGDGDVARADRQLAVGVALVLQKHKGKGLGAHAALGAAKLLARVHRVGRARRLDPVLLGHVQIEPVGRVVLAERGGVVKRVVGSNVVVAVEPLARQTVHVTNLRGAMVSKN